jgi:catalase
MRQVSLIQETNHVHLRCPKPKRFTNATGDVTKVWPKAEYPLIEVGVMELNRYPETISSK